MAILIYLNKIKYIFYKKKYKIPLKRNFCYLYCFGEFLIYIAIMFALSKPKANKDRKNYFNYFNYFFFNYVYG